MEFCELFLKLNDNIEKLTNEVLLLKLSNEALSMQMTDLSKGNKEKVMALMDMQDKVDLLQHEIKMQKTQNTTLNEKLLRLEFHQCRNNLVFSGIQETFNEPNYDCYSKIIELLSKVMDVSNVKITRCHRLRRFSKLQPRPIIANFMWYGDVTSILKVKSKLPSGVYINAGLPSEWVECRKITMNFLLNLIAIPFKYDTICLRVCCTSTIKQIYGYQLYLKCKVGMHYVF